MSLETNRFSIATASHLDPATAYSVAWPLAEHLAIAERSGFDGVELWPQEVGPMLEVRYDILSAREKAGVTSVHQSPIGRFPRPRSEHLKARLFLPDFHASLKDLDLIYQQVGDVPAVLFKDARSWDSPYSLNQVQADPETAHAWGIHTDDGKKAAEEYLRAAIGPTFNGVVIDTFHLRRRDSVTNEENPLADWRKSIPVLLPYTKEIHLGVGRNEYGDMAEKSQNELEDLLNAGTKNTEVTQMLRFIAETGWKGLIVVEFRPSSIKEEYRRKLLVLPKDLRSAYHRIRDTLYLIFDD